METTVRDLCDDVSTGLAQPWVRSVRHASTSRFDDLEDRLDRAVATTELGVSGTPGWCRASACCSGCCSSRPSVGAVWLAALAGMSYLQTARAPPRRTTRASRCPR